MCRIYKILQTLMIVEMPYSIQMLATCWVCLAHNWLKTIKKRRGWQWKIWTNHKSLWTGYMSLGFNTLLITAIHQILQFPGFCLVYHGKTNLVFKAFQTIFYKMTNTWYICARHHKIILMSYLQKIIFVYSKIKHSNAVVLIY